MLKKRDAQGISFRMIVLAVIALIVLIVAIIIFSQQFGKNTNTLESCEGRGGKCTTIIGCSDGRVMDEIDCGPLQVCCFKIWEKEE